MCKHRLFWMAITFLVLLTMLWVFNKPAANMNTVAQSCVLVYNESGHGSGAMVDVNCVLTAKHVADHMPLKIKTLDGTEYDVTSVKLDPDSDLAMLFIDGKFVATPLLLDPAPLHVGDYITLIGSPDDVIFIDCILPGHVVKTGVDITDMNEFNLVIYDAHADPGTSGGPVLDNKGHIRAVEVIGAGSIAGGVPVSELNL